MHNWDLISLWWWWGWGGWYLCTCDWCGHTACSPWPWDAAVAIVSTYHTSSPWTQRWGTAVTVDRNALWPRHSIDCWNAVYTTVYNCWDYICAYSYCANAQIAFFSSACQWDWKVWYIDFLLVGWWSSGGYWCTSWYCHCWWTWWWWGWVIECMHYPIKNTAYSITIWAWWWKPSCSCNGCFNPWWPTIFNWIVATWWSKTTSWYKYWCTSASCVAWGWGWWAWNCSNGHWYTFRKCCPEMHVCNATCWAASYICLYTGGNWWEWYTSSISWAEHSYWWWWGGWWWGRPCSANSCYYQAMYWVYAWCWTDWWWDWWQYSIPATTDGVEGAPTNHKWCDATYYWWWWGGGGNGWPWCWCQWIIIIRYHTDGSDWICAECSFWWCKYTCWEYTIHCFTDMSEHNEFIPVYKK